MKITIVVGGRWHAFDLARELHSHGHLHRLITTYPKWFVRRWGIPPELIFSQPVIFFVVKLIYKIGGESLMMRCQWFVHRWFAEWAVKYLNGSELIHGWSQWSEPSLVWAQRRDIPTVIERSSAHILEQSRLLTEEHSRLGMKWPSTHSKIESMELREYSLATNVAVPSLFVERSFIARGFAASKLFRNPLGVNLLQFKPPQHHPLPPAEIGLKAIYVGSLSVRKGIHDLLAGFLQANLLNSQLTLVGSKTPELEHLLSTKPNNVHCLGHLPQSELVDVYAQAHCFVMASIEEGMAMVQMQALACGLPLICTTNTGGEDLLLLSGVPTSLGPYGVQEFPAGFMVPINCPEAISWSLRKLALNTGLWETKRQKALQIAQTNLDWSVYAKRSIVLYEKLIKKSTTSLNSPAA
jgi:glycosyltransferase involved in cell wall biosynthesis